MIKEKALRYIGYDPEHKEDIKTGMITITFHNKEDETMFRLACLPTAICYSGYSG